MIIKSHYSLSFIVQYKRHVFYTTDKNTNLQPLTHKISTAYHTINKFVQLKKALEFLHPIPTIQMGNVAIATVIYC